MKLEALKGKNELEQIELKYKFELQLAGINNQGKIQNTATQTMGKLAEKEEDSNIANEAAQV